MAITMYARLKVQQSVLARKKAAVTPERRAQIQQRLLVAVEGLLAGDRSYPELSVQELLEAGGISRQTFYVYFEDKGRLLSHLADDVVADLVAGSMTWLQLPPSPTRGDLLERFRPMVERYRRHGRLLRAVADMAGSDEAMRAKLSGMVGAASAAFADAIRDGQREGAMRPELDPDELAPWLIWMAERGLAQLVMSEDDELVDRRVEALVDLLWFALYVPSG